MIFILVNWFNTLFLATVFGQCISFFLRKITKTENVIPQSIIVLLGLVVLNFLVDIIAIFFPINLVVQVTVEILACMVCTFLYHAKLLALRKNIFKGGWLQKIFYLIYGYICLYVAIRCYYPTSHYDEGLYYIQHVRWIQNYGFVPGLANLHLRLGFNSNWHNLAAFFDYPAFTKHFFNDLNGFLFLAFAYYCWSGISQLFRKKYTLSVLLKTFAIVILIYPNPYFFSTYNGIFVNTISPDWASFIFIATGFILFVEAFEKDKTLFPLYLFLITIFAVYSISIKIANIAVLLLVLYAIKWFWIQKKYQLLVILLSGLLVITMPWLISNVILSGYILYPISFLQIGIFDWTVPKHIVEYLAYETKTWAKTGGLIEVYPKLTFKELIVHWYHMQQTWLQVFYIVVIIIIHIFILFLSCEFIRLKRDFFKIYESILVIFASSITGIIFWFFTAPDFRFGAVFILFVVMLFLSLLIQNIKNRNYLKAILVMGSIIYLIPALTLNDIWRVFGRTFHTESEITEVQLKNQIYIPMQTDQCSDAKLPCTPDTELVKGKILLRKENDLGKGFILK